MNLDKCGLIMPSKVAIVIIAKNEEEFIGRTIEALLSQELPPYRIILVNDGSTDKTEEIASGFKKVEIINRKNRSEFLQAKKELANTINEGLSKLKNDEECEFVIKLDADIFLSKNYISEITKRMKSDPKIAVASGVIENEYSVIPRGAGRVVRLDFWKKIGLKYPVNYGFEGYLLSKARVMGYKVKVFPDLVMKTGRKTGSKFNPELYYYYGVGMKALGYTIPFALGRTANLVIRKPLGAYYMLKGFFSDYDQLYEPEIREFVKSHQYKKFKHLKLSDMKRIFR